MKSQTGTVVTSKRNAPHKSLDQPEAVVVSGSTTYPFSKDLALSLHIPLVVPDVLHFPDGETRVFIKEEVLAKTAIVVQSHARRPNDLFVETLLAVDALRRRGVRKVILVCPYLAYTRQSLAEVEGGSIASRLFARFLKEAGVDRMVVMDLHAEHIPAFYDFPVDHLTAQQLFVKELRKRKLLQPPLVVVGPDLGACKRVASYAEELGSSFALIEKKRLDSKHVESLSIVGEVKGKNVLLADEVCTTAGTLVSAAKACREKGANKIFACVTHGLFVDEALERIEKSPIDLLLVTDTVAPTEDIKRVKKICAISAVPAFSSLLTTKIL